jgi:hypothetical protein
VITAAPGEPIWFFRLSYSSALVASRSGRGRGGSAAAPDLDRTQGDAKHRFDSAILAAGPALPTSCGASSVPAKPCAIRESALGWPARAGKLALTLALDPAADFDRLR